jgi:hypothetical protein
VSLSGRITFFLNPVGISLWVIDENGPTRQTLRRPDDPGELKALFRYPLSEDGLEGKELDEAVREMMEKAEQYSSHGQLPLFPP